MNVQISQHSPEYQEHIFWLKVLSCTRKKTAEHSNSINLNNRETRILFQLVPRSFSAFFHCHRLFPLKCLYLFNLSFNFQMECKSDLKCSKCLGNIDARVIHAYTSTTFISCPRFSWDKASLCFETNKFLHSVVCPSKFICKVPQTSCWQKPNTYQLETHGWLWMQ